MNCRTVRREIEEASPGKWLSSDVNNHVLNCVACETLLREQTKLRELVSSLGTVEAPSDFDFRLRARLADEKRVATRPLTLGNFSFGLRPVAVVAVVLLIVSALTFVSFRTRFNNPVSQGVANIASNAGTSSPVATNNGGNTNRTEPVRQENVAVKPEQLAQKRHSSLRGTAVATVRDTHRQSTRDSASTSADMLRRDQVAGVYPTPAFPIDGGYQSLRVSVDDGRGISRTISLPSVSFGSQRSLSQGASPLMASARGAW
ncbi:MAG TPA: hypothetical protein VIF64_03110 [Pyrinomonadaceae bacterium]|jgi:hypothetical protein